MDGAVSRAVIDAKSLVTQTFKLVGVMIVGNVLFDGTELRWSVRVATLETWFLPGISSV